MKPKYLLAVGVLAAATLAAQQKPAQPQPTEQQKLKDRVEALESQVKQAQAKADHAAMEKDYIDGIQREARDYYEKAFNTLLKFGDWAVVLIAALPLVFGLVGFRAIDRRIQRRLRDASTQLRTEFNQRLEARFSVLEEKNADQMKQLQEALEKRVTGLEKDLKARADYQFQFSQGFASAVAARHTQARESFRSALTVYELGKLQELFPKRAGSTAAANLFVSFQKEDPKNYEENARKELEAGLYDDLEDELAIAAALFDIPWLGPLIKERKRAQPASAFKVATPKPSQPDVPQAEAGGTPPAPPRKPESK